MKKFTTLLLSSILLTGLIGCSPTDLQNFQSVVESLTAYSSTIKEEKPLFAELKGTYEELFTVISDPQYDSIWLSECAALVGEDAAFEAAEMLKSSCTGTIYGKEAVDVYGDRSNGMQFDCFFINGVSRLTFHDDVISGTDPDGNLLFEHTYKDAGAFSLAGMMEGTLYEATDGSQDSFHYFLMMPDTPDTTWHIEFRYGNDLDALGKYNEGDLAYWLAAGIRTDHTNETIENVIRLFCEENLSGE